MKPLLSCLLLLMLTACQPDQSDSKPMSNAINPIEITIKVGENDDAFAQRNIDLLHQDIQPAGLTFYEIDRDPHQLATVQVTHGKASLTIPYVLGVMGTLNTDYPAEGLYKFHVYAALTDQDTLSDEAVRVYINSLLQQFRAKGWQPLFYYDAPRLRGQEQFDYALAEHSFELDGGIDLSPHNWQRIDWIASTSWMFYADNVLAQIEFRRSPTWEDPKQPGTGLLTIDFQSMESFLRVEIEEKDRANWRAFWPAKAKWYRERRDSEEIRLHKEGKHIDLHYQDPPLPPPPPGQRNPELPPEVTRPAHPLIKSSARVPLQRDARPLGTTCHTGESCPQSGIWHAQFPPHSISNRLPGYDVQRFFAQGSLMPPLPVHYPRLLGRWLGYPARVESVRWILMAYQ